MAGLFAVFSDLDLVPLEGLERLSTLTLGIVAKDPRYTEVELETLYASLGEALTKRAYAGLATLVTDMARLDAGSSQVVSTLEENGLADSAKTAVIGRLFEKFKPAVRLALGQTLGVAMPKLVDIDWRLDYVVRSSDTDNPSPLVPIYYVKLYIAAPVQLHDADKESRHLEAIDLALSVEQMQDFLLTVRDANHQAARLGAARRA